MNFLLRFGNSYLRRVAVISIGDRSDDRSIEKLTKSLVDGSSRVRCAAIEALGRHSNLSNSTTCDYVVDALIQMLEDRDTTVRKTSAKVLGAGGPTTMKEVFNSAPTTLVVQLFGSRREITQGKIINALISILGDSEGSVRLASANSLARLGETRWKDYVTGKQNDIERIGLLGDKRVINPLVRALDSNINDMAEYAARELRNRHKGHSDQVVKALIHALGSPFPEVRKSSIDSLASIVSHTQLEFDRIIDPLIIAVRDTDRRVRFSATDTLLTFGDNRALSSLIERLKNDSDARIRSEIAGRLRHFEDEQIADLLICVFEDDKDEGVKESAAFSIASIGATQAVDPMIKALNDPDCAIAVSVINALGRLGDSRAYATIVRLLDSPNKEVRYAVVGAIGKLGNDRLLDPLVHALEDPAVFIREKASQILVEICIPQKEEILGWKLKDFEYDVSAAIALHEIGDHRAYAMLSSILRDRRLEGGLRKLVATLLVKYKIPSTTDLLLTYIDDFDVGYNVCKTLGQLGDRRAIMPLIEKLGDYDGRLRVVVASALKNLGEQKWVQLIKGDDMDFDRLGNFEGKNSVIPLITAVVQNDEKYAVKAAHILGYRGEVQSIRPLIDGLTYGSLTIRVARATSLIDILMGNPEVVLEDAAKVFATITCPSWSNYEVVDDMMTMDEGGIGLEIPKVLYRRYAIPLPD